MSVQKMYFMCIYSPDSFVGFADICADPRRNLPALAQSHEGSRSAHVEHQLRILRAHPLQDAGQCVRVARDRVQFRLRETDELQKHDPAVYRFDRGDGRVADDGQPRDGRAKLRVQGAAVAGDVRARLEVIAGLECVARQLGQQIERPCAVSA